MSNTDALFPVVRDEIVFDNLLAQATKVLTTYAGQCWTDTAEHDPGITLLEALSYGVADLAYRQTRPLTDLLTPSPSQQVVDGGLFPQEFGPQQALTCGPVSEQDYRRAILDLHSSGTEEGYFFFSNVRLVREPEADRYQYWYNPEFREYQFTKPEENSESTAFQISLLGNYHLYLVPSRETEKDPLPASTALASFLLNNRNLGESVSRVVWLEPEDLMLDLIIELEDNISANSNVAVIYANIYQVAENYIRPPLVRYSTTQLRDIGMSTEDIFQGPWLRHGWLPSLPPHIDSSTHATVSLSGLVDALLTVKGVKGIRKLSCGSETPSHWQWVANSAGTYPRLWGEDPLAVMSEGNYVQLLANGDIPLNSSKEEIQAEIKCPALILNSAKVLPYGRWREPGKYYPATEIIPPCYNLKIPATSSVQTHLHQFLLMFEQILANACQQQAILPDLLSFKRQGDVVWGAQWPFAADTISDDVHRAYSSVLKDNLAKSSHDRSHELSIIGYLLSYFYCQLAPEIFGQPSEQYLASQQGYLSRLAELGYHRANIRCDQVSSLQRRIAARLGLGGAAIFDDTTPFAELPFYLVEHKALMPLQPDPQYNLRQTPVFVVAEEIDGEEFLTLTCENLGGLTVGHMVDVLLNQGTKDEFRIRGQMVRRIDPQHMYFSLSLTASVQLKRNLSDILSASPQTLSWQNSDVWLEDMNFPLIYDSDQTNLPGDQKRLMCSPFPVMIMPGDVLVLEYQITKNAIKGRSYDDLIRKLTVVSVDPIANTLVIHCNDPLPHDVQTSHYQWHFASSSHAVKDRFSFMVSVVFNQALLLELTEDPYAAEAWVREAILGEVPSHIGVLLHWKPRWEFNQFAHTYSQWQSDGAALGDKSFELLRMLSLGNIPYGLDGIGSMYVATAAQQADVVGEDGSEWNSDVIEEDQLFYVPLVDDSI